MSRWGVAGGRRYEALLAAAIRQLAFAPEGPGTRQRTDLPRDLRSFHLRHTWIASLDQVRAPVHVIYHRVPKADLIEVVAVLYDRMDPTLHVGPEDTD
jgi:plasmid stabilization system protein ParE